MNNVTELGHLLPIAERVGASLAEEHGGFLRCESCGGTLPLQADRAAGYMGSGWPTCHGETMRWWTQRQIDAGEIPA